MTVDKKKQSAAGMFDNEVQWYTGATGAQGTTGFNPNSGSILYQLHGTPVPTGYVIVSTVKQMFKVPGSKAQKAVIDILQKQ